MRSLPEISLKKADDGWGDFPLMHMYSVEISGDGGKDMDIIKYDCDKEYYLAFAASRFRHKVYKVEYDDKEDMTVGNFVDFGDQGLVYKNMYRLKVLDFWPLKKSFDI